MNSPINIFLFLLLQLSLSSFVHTKSLSNPQDQCLEIQFRWLEKNLHLTKNCVGFSAPVAARTMSYLAIGNYESMLGILQSNQSLSGQLQKYNRTVWPNEKETIYYPHVANFINKTLDHYFFANMPPSELRDVEKMYDEIYTEYTKQTSKKALKNSEIFALKLANEIIEWSKTDGGDRAYSRNFPASYHGEECQSCWVKTYPGYKPALLPYWGQNRLMIQSNGDETKDITIPVFSTDTNSVFYRDAFAVSELYKNLTIDQETIAEYWDDGPGISGTPVGHLFEIALNLSKDKNVDLQTYLELVVELGVAINDAIIETWRMKYAVNLIRPITYIQQYIRKDFNTILETPSFPEFPSGHSFQAGAGLEVFKNYFSNEMSFADSTNVERKDINGKVRNYNNFSEMAEEMSISRFYGGIHFQNTLKVSLEFGGKIGLNTLNQLKLRK